MRERDELTRGGCQGLSDLKERSFVSVPRPKKYLDHGKVFKLEACKTIVQDSMAMSKETKSKIMQCYHVGEFVRAAIVHGCFFRQECSCRLLVTLSD